MAKYKVASRASSKAPPAKVWDVLADVPRWAEWGPWNSTTFEREGDPPPGGVGAVRLLKRFAMTLREELTAYEPPRHMAYQLLSGMPVRDYRAEVTVSGSGEGSELHWRSEFDALPGVGELYRWQLQKGFEDITASVARAAEQR
jgi:uncharacterized protein YndB with AHSA1/START domain